jgi:hypothetical protein
MDDKISIPDGLDAIRNELPVVTRMIVRTARWIHPDAFRALPVWYPETARGQPMYDASWTRVYKNTDRETKSVEQRREPNIKAAKAFIAALGAVRTPNWTVCHIWGVDDDRFQESNVVVRDPRYYSCVGNMVWLPTPLKGFTDAIPEIKRLLRVCAFHLYGWICRHEHPTVASESTSIRSGSIPDGYPPEWPTADRRCLPPNTAPYTPLVRERIDKRKGELRRMLGDPRLTMFPREQVQAVLQFWGVAI